jgi:hypothetical protein
MGENASGTPVGGGRPAPSRSSFFEKILKDKRLLMIAGVGAVAGLAVFITRGGSPAAEDTPGYGVQTDGVAPYDSTSADIASQLGQYQTGLQIALGEYSREQQQQLADYGDQLTESLAELKTPVTDPAVTPSTPITSPETPSVISSIMPVTVKKSTILPSGAGWFATGSKSYTADSIARRYQISVDMLKALNPNLHITSPSSKIGKNLPVKVRSNAAPWSLADYRRFNKIGK